jgi:O-antigen/teichoic acid export membrane protein
MKQSLIDFAASAFRHQRVRQTALLYSSEIGLILLTFGTGILNSRFLGPTQYGTYTFVITVVEVVLLLAGFGFPNAGARVIALAEDAEDQRAKYGALILIAIIMGIGMTLVLALCIPLIAGVFHIQNTGPLWLACVLCGISPISVMLAQSCRGGNRIGLLATLNILPKALYLLGGVGIVFWGKMTATAALALYFGGILAASILVVGVLQIRFHNVRAEIRRVTREVKEYGFKTYIGGLADNSTFKLNNLLIAGYVDTVWLGFYSIASTMVSPLVRFSTSLSTSAFRSLAQKQRISLGLLLANAGFLLLGAIFVALCARTIIVVVLTPQFLPAVGLVYVLVFTAFFQGMYQPINAYLCAHGKGRELRSISFVVSAVNLVISLSLIPRLGAYGAAVGSSVAKLAELLGNVYYYRQVTREAKGAEPVPASAAELLS